MDHITPFGDFSFITDNNMRIHIEDAFNAVSKTERGWEFMRSFAPKQGFMYADHPKLSEISHKLNMHLFNTRVSYEYASTMREIEYIAKRGWSNYVQAWNHTNNVD
jgi:hypothetical protein